MTYGNNGNRFRDDEIIILEQFRDGEMVKNIFPKIGESLIRRRMLNSQNPLAIIASSWYSYQ